VIGDMPGTLLRGAETVGYQPITRRIKCGFFYAKKQAFKENIAPQKTFLILSDKTRIQENNPLSEMPSWERGITTGRNQRQPRQQNKREPQHTR